MRKKIKNKPFYGWYLVIITWLMAFLVSATAFGIFFKPLLDEFGWSRARLSLVSTFSLLVLAILTPFLGRLIDRFGPRSMLLAVTAGQVLSAVSGALAHSLPVIYLSRFLYELKPTHASQILINRWFVRRRGQALGILSSGIPLGQLALSPLSQYLITAWGWRETLFFWAAVSTLLAVPILFIVKDHPRDRSCLPDGEKTGTQDRTSGPITAAGITPDIKIKTALKMPAFWLLAVAHTICGITCGLMATHIVVLAVDLGYSPIIGASFLSVQGGVSLLGVLATGFLADRLARSRVLALTHLIRSLGLWLLVAPLLAGLNNLGLIYSAMAVYGFGWFTTAPLAAGLAADLFGNFRMGTLLGIILACHMVGMAAGAYAGGLSFQITGSYQLILTVTAVLEAGAALCSFFIRPAINPARF